MFVNTLFLFLCLLLNSSLAEYRILESQLFSPQYFQYEIALSFCLCWFDGKSAIIFGNPIQVTFVGFNVSIFFCFRICPCVELCFSCFGLNMLFQPEDLFIYFTNFRQFSYSIFWNLAYIFSLFLVAYYFHFVFSILLFLYVTF